MAKPQKVPNTNQGNTNNPFNPEHYPNQSIQINMNNGYYQCMTKEALYHDFVETTCKLHYLLKRSNEMEYYIVQQNYRMQQFCIALI